MEPPEIPAPARIEFDRAHGLTLGWDDGTELSFGLEELRVNCPCAECRGLREQQRPVWPKPGSPQPLEGVTAELVGGWGLTITWNDSHATGIFTWNLLRAWRASD
jgi:ATP-binding protein involved in chromosome partitioning